MDPRRYHPPIGLIACGGITWQHLKAYKKAGYNVVALCDKIVDRAEQRRKEFFPKAEVYSDYRDLLKRTDIEVVDVAAHPDERVPLLKVSLQAGKHVLSQKPFVLDLAVGEGLADLADRQGVKLAVNQNGRWAPHFSYMRQAIAAGLVGELATADFAVHWDHNWVAGSKFDQIHHLILYDFAIHWFDMAAVFFGNRPALKVFASVQGTAGQKARPPLLAHAVVDFEGGQATFSFNGDCPLGQWDCTTVTGSKGTLRSQGTSLSKQKVTLYNPGGYSIPRLNGSWFPDGFHGTMGELLCAIEEKREPENSARRNLKSVALCFAAVASADSGRPVVPGKVRKISAP
jgi:predicted dehydrogenase